MTTVCYVRNMKYDVPSTYNKLISAIYVQATWVYTSFRKRHNISYRVMYRCIT